MDAYDVYAQLVAAGWDRLDALYLGRWVVLYRVRLALESADVYGE